MDDEREVYRPDSKFRSAIQTLTSELGSCMKKAYDKPDDKNLLDKCKRKIDEAVSSLIPKNLAEAGLSSTKSEWELSFEDDKKWSNGTIVLVAHATTEKRRLVILSTDGCAKNVPDIFKVDMVALGADRQADRVSIIKHKPLNIISIKKTWWAMNTHVLSLGLKANYDKVKKTFSIKENDQATLRELYDKHVKGMEKSPEFSQRVEKDICLEQFAIGFYPTKEWKLANSAVRHSKPQRFKGMRKPSVNYKSDEGLNFEVSKQRLKSCRSYIDELLDDDAGAPSSTKKPRLNGKIIRLTTLGHRLEASEEIKNEEVLDNKFMDYLDSGETQFANHWECRNGRWEFVDNILREVGQCIIQNNRISLSV